MANKIQVRVPASTSNLGSGFDTFGLALKLYLTVGIETGASGLQVTAEGENADDIPRDETNLIFRAMQHFCVETGTKLPGVALHIDNQIPLFRGLGSSGAATVAGLLCSAKLTGTDLSKGDLLSMASDIEGHPENAASSLHGGLTINCIEGGKVICKKIEVDEQLQAVLLIPDNRISTQKARKVLPEKLELARAIYNVQRSALLTHAFAISDFSDLKIAMQDKLHQPFRKHLMPGYDQFEKAGYAAGALGVCVSGSGSAILALTMDASQRIREKWKSAADDLGISAQIVILKIANRGAEIT